VIRLLPVAALTLCAAVCGGSPPSPGDGLVVLTDPGSADTVRFTVPVAARRCAGNRGLLVTGLEHGQGVLVWVRDSGTAPVVGRFPLLPRADSTSARGAIVSVRFVAGAIAHGVTVDDGSATLTQSSSRLGLVIQGRGQEPTIGVPHEAAIALSGVPVESDTVSCHAMP
jgi:hypothetical protein